mgnify:CR=1 FL=1
MGFTILLLATCIIIIILGISECYILKIKRRAARVMPRKNQSVNTEIVNTEVVNPRFTVII